MEIIRTPDLEREVENVKDNLKVIEGIGPKIEELLNENGILNYQRLSETSVDELKEILSIAGPPLIMHDPTTWPQKAKLASSENREKLEELKDTLNRGKGPEDSVEPKNE